MSMTVHIAMKGITDLEVLMEALREMELAPKKTHKNENRSRIRNTLAHVNIDGHLVGFTRNKEGELLLKGDSDWNIMKKGNEFHQKLKQYYSLASVKRKAKELRYSIASVDLLENGSIKLVARAWG